MREKKEKRKRVRGNKEIKEEWNEEKIGGGKWEERERKKGGGKW